MSAILVLFHLFKTNIKDACQDPITSAVHLLLVHIALVKAPTKQDKRAEISMCVSDTE